MNLLFEAKPSKKQEWTIRSIPWVLHLAAVAGIYLSGCSSKIDDHPMPLPHLSQFQPALPSTPDAGTEEPWWLSFHSPEMHQLIETALRDSTHVAIVEKRVAQAQALQRFAAADLLPGTSASIAASERIDNSEVRNRELQFGIDTRWRIDISGGLRMTHLARKYTVLGRNEELRMARLDLSVNVALAYLNLVTQQQLAELLSRQEENARTLLEVAQSRFEQGISNRLEMLQQEGLVAEIQMQRAGIERERRQSQLQLNVLTETLPGESGTLLNSMQFPELPPSPEFGKPVDLLTRRPDLVALQKHLVAAKAELASAAAARWPSFVIGLDLNSSNPMSEMESFAELNGALQFPVFDGGRIRAEQSRRAAIQDEQLAVFSIRFLNAVAEVEDFAFAEKQQLLLLRLIDHRLGLLQEAEIQANNRYSQGFTDFLPVITVRQDILLIEQRRIREQHRLIAIRVQLYRALGGPVS